MSAEARRTCSPEEGARKKRHTTDELRELVKSVGGSNFHYDDERPKRSLDWASYNEAQLHGMSDALGLTMRFVNLASSRMPEGSMMGRRGRPPFPAGSCQGAPSPVVLRGLRPGGGWPGVLLQGEAGDSERDQPQDHREWVRPRSRVGGSPGGIQDHQRVWESERNDVLRRRYRQPHLDEDRLRARQI